MQHHDVAFGVAFQDRVLCDVRHGCAPRGCEMACCFFEFIVETVLPACVLYDGDALHEVRDGDQVAFDGDVDWGGGGAVAGDFVEGVVFEFVNNDLVVMLALYEG